MTTFFVGKVDEVRPINRKDKATGAITTLTQVTLTFEGKDNEGYLVKSTENITFDVNALGGLQQAKGKYLVIPYTTINTKGGTYTFPDDNLDFIISDKNPLDIKKTA